MSTRRRSSRRTEEGTSPALANVRRDDGPPLASSARTELAAASHEIRAPLHTILGMSELLTRTTLTPAQAQYLDALRRAATSLTSLLDSLLDARRHKDEPVRQERLWLPDVVEAAVATVRERAAVAGLELVVDVNSRVPRRVFGDGVRVQQVLINLLSNAVKYGERGTVTLRIDLDHTARAVTADDVVPLVIAVSDEGPGIAAARLEEIFFIGQRLAQHAHIAGSGLGLPITRRIINDLGGHLHVESRARGEVAPDVATGTVFRAVLPFLRTGSVDTVEGRGLAVRGVRFLIVGDEVLCAAVRSALAPWSPFLERVDVDDAVARWRVLEQSAAPSHLVIVAGEALPAVAGIAEGRVIAVLSSSSLAALGNDVERAGATPILLPITTGNLYNAVERVLHRLSNVDAGSNDLDIAGAVVHAADDDPDARLLIELFLRDTGVTLHLHATTAALITAVNEDPTTTLVLCDVEMPDGGARVARAAMPLRKGVSFVPITAHGDSVIDDLRGEGFVDVARKPLTRRGLIDVIMRRGLPAPEKRTATRPSTTLLRAPPSVAGAPANAANVAAVDVDTENLQLEARMALARRDYRALTLLGRRLSSPYKERLEVAARAKNDAGVRDVLRDLEHGPARIDTVDDAIRALLPDYLERRKSDAAEVAEALTGGRFDQIAFIGHRLSGTARAFGMESLSDVGVGLERAGRRRDGDEVRGLLQRMHQLLAEVRP